MSVYKIKHFWDKPLSELTDSEWEQLCDGCGLCCIEKVEDENQIYYTKIVCELLDKQTGQCTNYNNRNLLVTDCIDLRKENFTDIDWLPDSCAYVLRDNDKPLPRWHYLIDAGGKYKSENPNKLFIEHKMIYEKEMKPNSYFEDYLLKRVL